MNHPIRKTMCATCPFRRGSEYRHLVDNLSASALNEAMRICHSTGTNAIGGRTGIKSHICRGAFEIQKAVYHAFGVLKEKTDAAWNAARLRNGQKQLLIKNP